MNEFSIFKKINLGRFLKKVQHKFLHFGTVLNLIFFNKNSGTQFEAI